MNEHTLTIKLTEVYIPDGDEVEFRESIDHVIENITAYTKRMGRIYLQGDVYVTVSVSRPEKEPA